MIVFLGYTYLDYANKLHILFMAVKITTKKLLTRTLWLTLLYFGIICFQAYINSYLIVSLKLCSASLPYVSK